MTLIRPGATGSPEGERWTTAKSVTRGALVPGVMAPEVASVASRVMVGLIAPALERLIRVLFYSQHGAPVAGVTRTPATAHHTP
jgi:hypothetical protein